MKLATISWTFGIEDTDELFKHVKAAGYQALQYCGDHTKIKAEDVLAAAKKYDLELLSFDPFNCKPAHPTDANLANCVKWYMDVMDFATSLGVSMMTLQGLSTWTINEPDYDASMKFIVEAVKALDLEAQKRDLILTYEACNHYEVPWVQTANELLYIKEASGAKQLQFVLDSFHMHISEKDMESPLRKVGPLLHSYHVSDSGRGGIGSGQIDFEKQFEILAEIGFEGPVFLEIVLPSVRPYKLPMSPDQQSELTRQCLESQALWSRMNV